MLVASGTQISAYDKKRFVLNTREGRNLLINNEAVKLFLILQSTNNLESARKKFNFEFNCTVSPDYFSNLIQQNFGGYSILVGESCDEKKSQRDYIKLKVQIFNSRAAGLFARPFQRFYHPLVFWPTLVTLIAFLGFIHLNFSVNKSALGKNFWIILPIIYVSMFVHEFGHIASCRFFKVRHGGIGFGFYLFIFPVLYADVTNIWQATKHQRIITNLAGIFSQFLYAMLLSLAFMITKFYPLLYASIAVTVSAVWQLNPFVRHDGYWLLSDLTNTPNLLWKSAAVLRKTLSWHTLSQLFQAKEKFMSGKDVLLLLYGIINNSMILIFAYFIISRRGEQLLELPRIIVDFIVKISKNSVTLIDIKAFPFSSLIFYIIIVRYLATLFLRFVPKMSAFNKHSLTTVK